MSIQRILITPGEPAGIGPDIVIQIAQEAWPVELVAIADPDLLLDRAKQLGLPLHLDTCNLQQPPQAQAAQTLKILPSKLNAAVTPGVLNPANADYVMRTLTEAATLCLAQKAQAIVPGPVNKSVLNAAGITFSGHTEFFAAQCKVGQTVMLFVVDALKVALVTTHLPLADVSKAITKARLRSTLTILNNGLQRYFGIARPTILICGLNPHAGEGGYLGREEIETIAPLLDELRAENYRLEGPLPADTLFTPNYLARADAVVAMYHDQALPLVKYVGFGHAVNLTLGLPFIRTSVDHGTALDIAATGTANPGSLHAALKLAIQLSK